MKTQNARLFHKTLNRALEIDVDAHPEKRLENTIFRRRATRLKAMSEDLFLEDVQDEEETGTSTTAESRPT